jgi:ribosomal protein S8
MGSSPMFPNMFYNYFYNYVLNHLMLNSNKKKLNFEILYTKKILKLLILLKNIGLLKSFVIIKNKNSNFISKKNKIRIFIFYYNKSPVCKFLKLYSTPSRNFTISYKALLLLSNRTGSSLYILSTPLGLLTHLDAFKYKIGGKIITRITL